MKLSAASLLLSLALVGTAFAQTIPYSTNSFSATFKGSVTPVIGSRNMEGSSTEDQYTVHGGITQWVNARIVDYDIPVNKLSLDYYAGQMSKDGTLIRRDDGITNQGYIRVYVVVNYKVNGVAMQRRARVIIKDSRHMFFVVQQTPANVDDQADWNTFKNSFVIKSEDLKKGSKQEIQFQIARR